MKYLTCERLIKGGIKYSILMSITICFFFLSCKKEGPSSTLQGKVKIDYISGIFDKVPLIYDYKIESFPGQSDSYYDSSNFRIHSVFASSTRPENLTLFMSGIDLDVISFPFTFPSVLDSLTTNPTANFNLKTTKDIGTSNSNTYIYNLTTESLNSVITIDSYDKINSLLRGRFYGQLLGYVVKESIPLVPDTILVENGEFCIKLRIE